MKRIFTLLTVALLVSCTDSPLESEDTYEIPLLRDQQEPCTPSFIAQDEEQNLFVCDKDSVWVSVAHENQEPQEPDTIWLTKTDTLTKIEREIIRITDTTVVRDTTFITDTLRTISSKCGPNNFYDTLTQFCDYRDNKIYSMVRIGNQMWMKQNLNYGDTVWAIDSVREYHSGRLCYNNHTSNCDRVGGYYDWRMAMDSASLKDTMTTIRGVCPYGWHIPDSTEWRALANNLSMSDWYNRSYFNGGQLSGWWSGDIYAQFDIQSLWWVASKTSRMLTILKGNNTVRVNYYIATDVGAMSVRCVRDY